MASQLYYDVARDGSGNIIPGATVTIFDAGTSTVSTIHSDAALTTAKTNPITTDAEGEYEFYTGANTHKIRIEKTGYTTWERDNVSMLVVDHGEMSGLTDDDHSQYHNDTRGDVRYFQKTEHLDTSAGAGDAGKPVKLDAGGQLDATMLNDADIDHSALTSLTTGDPHSQYLFLAGRSGQVVSDDVTVDNLIASGPIVNAEHPDFGGTWDGATDDAAALQAAIDSLPTTGGVVLIPPLAAIASTVVLGDAISSAKSTRNNIWILGRGGGVDEINMGSGALSGASRIKWTGSAGGTMIEVNGPVSGVRIENLVLDCNSLAATGLRSIRSFNQTCRNVVITRWAAGYGLRVDADRTYSGTGGGGSPMQHLYEMVNIVDPKGTASGAHGVQIGSNVNGNFNVNEATFLRCQIERGDDDLAEGVWLGNCDHLAFVHSWILRRGATTGKAIVVAPQSGSPQRPSNITFVASPIQGGVFHDSSASAWTRTDEKPALLFWPFYTADSQQVPPVGANSTTLPYRMVRGWTDDGREIGAVRRRALVSSSAAVANTVTETAFDKTLTLRTEELNQQGVTVRIDAAGIYSTTGTPTLTLRVKLEGTTVWSAALATASSASGYGWRATGSFVIDTAGSSGVIRRGPAHFGAGSFGSTTHEIPTEGGTQSGFSFLFDRTISVTVEWGTADPANTATLTYLTAVVTPAEPAT